MSPCISLIETNKRGPVYLVEKPSKQTPGLIIQRFLRPYRPTRDGKTLSAIASEAGVTPGELRVRLDRGETITY